MEEKQKKEQRRGSLGGRGRENEGKERKNQTKGGGRRVSNQEEGLYKAPKATPPRLEWESWVSRRGRWELSRFLAHDAIVGGARSRQTKGVMSEVTARLM